ncbi:MAG: DUF4185 domain-containing protein [Pedobacter sp.]|nr:MAG: DUF4185 domain-containing protein [Pedobacter sp.]
MKMRLICYVLIALPVMVYSQHTKKIVVSDVQRIARVTGKSLPDETIPNPNLTDVKYDIGGTDLGISWIMGNRSNGFFFGDTYGKDWKLSNEGGPGTAGNWRSNVLGISKDTDLENGVAFDSMVSKEIIPSGKVTDGTGSHTTIPTAAIHANGKEYVHYMEIRKWGSPGSWTTNYSGLYKSTTNGLSWLKCEGVSFLATSNFAQVAYGKKDGYVYMIGTKSGRWGGAYLARFKEKDMEKQSEYEYWNKVNGWVKGEELKADVIIDAPLGEMSLMYHTKYKRWLLTYLNEKKAELVLRDATVITGLWSEEQTLVKGANYPGLYGAFIYPAKTNSDQLYFMMSMWRPYNVFLMKATIKFAK